jgi:TRAP-type C4-dicarboxylate transport system substrate-binding protein
LRAANVVYDLVNASESPVVMAGAVAETYHLDCPECKADFRKHNTLFLANYASTRFNMLCGKPMKSLADAKGRKMRVVGALGRFIKQIGAVPVGGSPTKAVQGMQRGNIDCIVGPISWLQSFGMWDIAKHVFDAPLAIQPTPSSMVINRDSWNKLSRAERMAMVKHAPALVARTTIDGYMAEDALVRKDATKRGITIIKAGAEVRQALAKHKEKELSVVPAVAKKEGVKNPGKILKAHLDNVAKWEKIHARTGDDVGKFAQALWDEVFSKLDPDKM